MFRIWYDKKYICEKNKVRNETNSAGSLGIWTSRKVRTSWLSFGLRFPDAHNLRRYYWSQCLRNCYDAYLFSLVYFSVILTSCHVMSWRFWAAIIPHQCHCRWYLTHQHSGSIIPLTVHSNHRRWFLQHCRWLTMTHLIISDSQHVTQVMQPQHCHHHNRHWVVYQVISADSGLHLFISFSFICIYLWFAEDFTLLDTIVICNSYTTHSLSLHSHAL